MLTDIEIAQAARMRPIVEVAADLGLAREDLVLKGDHIAKVKLSPVEHARKERQTRQLRNIGTGLGGKKPGFPREDGFIVTAASEVMAILCLAEGIRDLKDRLARIVVAFDRREKPVTAGDLYVHGAGTILLKDALMPNLVQTIEGTPALVHGGSFSNIAHGHTTGLPERLR